METKMIKVSCIFWKDERTWDMSFFVRICQKNSIGTFQYLGGKWGNEIPVFRILQSHLPY
jgi:hypothetical protein